MVMTAPPPDEGDGGDSTAPFSLGRVTVPKASDVLADQLRQQILDGTLPEGSALPVERVLASTVGLGRGTVRDALRVLEIEGLVVTKPGRAGGSFVRRPDSTTFTRSLNVLMHGRGIRFRSLLETREALEPSAARLAALHRTDADLAALEETSEKLLAAKDAGDIPLFLAQNVEWHVAVGAASHNEIIDVIVHSLSRVMLRSTEIDDFNSEKTMGDTIKAHGKILDAIRQGDADRAAAAMTKHVHTYRVLVEEYALPTDVPL